MATRGYASPELRENFAKARGHCDLLGDSPQLFPVLWGLWGYYMVRGECKVALQLAEQSLQVAEKVDHLALLVEGHRMLLETHLALGEFTKAREHLERASRLEEPQLSLPPFLHGHSPSVTFRGSGSVTLWCLGYPDRSLKLSQASLAVAQASGHPNNFGLAFAFAIVLGMLRREAEPTKAIAEAAIKLGQEHKSVLVEALGTLGYGWAVTEVSQDEEGLSTLQQGITGWQTRGGGLWAPLMDALLVERYRRMGQITTGWTMLKRAFDHAYTFHEYWCEAELFRLKGKLLIEQGAPEAEVEEAFQQGIEVARRQQAKAWELRLVNSLYRFRQGQGRSKEARALLEEVYCWFQEGFATPDLKEAAELLKTQV